MFVYKIWYLPQLAAMIFVLSISFCTPSAHGAFTPAAYNEYLGGCSFGWDCDSVGGLPHVPMSVEFDWYDQAGPDYLSISAKAQTNGGLAPAVDLSISFSTRSSGPSLDGSGEAQLWYDIRANYNGSGSPPVSTVPLVFIYQMETRVAATGWGYAESYVELKLDGEYIAEVVGGYDSTFGVYNGGGFKQGSLLRSLPAGVEHRLTLTAHGAVGNPGGNPTTPNYFSASLVAVGDPLVQFAPGFEYADEYEIVLEPGSLQNNPDFSPSVIPPFGDLDGDGFVGIADLNIVLGNWNQYVSAADWAMGDPSGDGYVGIEDLNTVLGNWNAGTPPLADANIPEPASLAIFVLIGISLLPRTQRRV